jgi:membrane protein insertase Oxa1/YidC/SpoIIIJ
MKTLVAHYGSAANIPLDALPKIESWLWIHNVWQPDTALFSLTQQPGAFTFMGMDSHIIPPFQVVQRFSNFKGITADAYTNIMKPLMDAHSSNWNGWFIMPLLAGVSSFLQMKISMPPQPANPDPKAQQNPFNSKFMLYLFPLMSVYFTATSNSIFALYWFTSNVCVTVTYKAFDIYWTAKMKRQEAEDKARLEQQQKEEAERIAAAAALKAARAEAKNKAKEGK